jgi:hypothetical protein
VGCYFAFHEHSILQLSDHVGWGWEYVCKVLELCSMDDCLRNFNLINSCEALSLNIVRMERLIGGLIAIG